MTRYWLIEGRFTFTVGFFERTFATSVGWVDVGEYTFATINNRGYKVAIGISVSYTLLFDYSFTFVR